ncbi:MAG: type II secretion system F family protein [Alphaproteobacteria bacterium]|nr:type II secretion system F family protein [Alphaproteobacteria bacterium]
MASYRYKAMTEAGAIVRGTLDASSEAAAIRALRAQGHYPLSATASDAGTLADKLTGLMPGKRAPSLRLLALATQELAELLGAGLELDRALSVLIGLKNLRVLKEPLTAVRGHVRDGAVLADALAQEKAFPKFYVGMVRAGELGGALEPALRRLSGYLTRTQAIRDSIASALVYPAILTVTAGFSIFVILAFVLPEFKPLFAQTGAQLPLPSRMVMAFGDAVRDWWWLGALVAASLWLWLRQALKDNAVRRRIHKLVLRIPILGNLLAAIEIERFNRMLGTLLGNGVELPMALNLAKDVLWNTTLSDAVRDTAASLREGEGFARKLAQFKEFSDGSLDLIQIGEETGKLDDMLIRQADLDEQRIKHTIDRLLAMLVPALTILLGLVIAGLIASMLIAILSVNDLALQ